MALAIASIIATLTALAHLSCIHLEPKCFQAQMAPQAIVQSAIDGTWLAPIGTIFVSILFLLCGAYALSGAGFIKRLPFLSFAIYSISIICILRVLVILLLLIKFPQAISSSVIIAEIVWLISGLLFFFGYRNVLCKNT